MGAPGVRLMAPVRPVRHDWRLIPAASAVWLGTIWAVAAPATAVRTAAARGGALTLLALAVMVWGRKAYPINAQVWQRAILIEVLTCGLLAGGLGVARIRLADRKSTRLNFSHVAIS